MIVGFTGTQNGINLKQFDELVNYLKKLNVIEAHHGDCIGADATFHDIVSNLEVKIVIHPPEMPHKRAFKKSEFIQEKLPYLKRNRNIVDSCDILIACPKEVNEQLRSGTWSTIRYARKRKKEIIIIYPS